MRYKLIDVLPETLTNQFDFTVTYTPPVGEAQTFTIFDTNLFVQELTQHFFDREIRLGVESPSANLVALFTRWKNSRSDAYARRAYALSLKYDPLENYDRMEVRTGSSETTHGETITRTHTNDTDTRTYTNYSETNTRSGSETMTSGLYGTNSSTSVPADTVTRTYNNVTDTKGISGSYADTHTGTIADAHTGKDSVEDGYTLRAHGNIGVMTTGAMLLEDKRILNYDLALIGICEFIDRYTFYEEGIDL